MNGLRRRALVAFIFAATLALLVVPLLPCRAQTKETVKPPDVPAALWIPDRFERAARYDFPEQTYLTATIVNDATGEKKEVCITGRALLYAVCLENNLPVSEGIDAEDKGEVRAKGERIIWNNRTRVFHFTKEQAWATAQPRYTPESLAQARKQFRTVSTEVIARRFDMKNHLNGKEADALLTDAQKEEIFAPYLDAIASVWAERGLYVGRHYFWGRPYVITASELAKRDEQERAFAEEMRQAEKARQRIASRLRGYNAVSEQFLITDASEKPRPKKDDTKPPHSAFVLKPKKPGLIDAFHWYNPLARNGKPRYDWKQFTEVANHLERLARLHPWLKAWKDGDAIRTIEVAILGKKPIIETNTGGETLWSTTGLVGKPYCPLLLLEVDDDISGSALVYLPPPDGDETRGLIAYCGLLSYQTKAKGDWLNTLKFRADPKAPVRQCVVVTPNGDWKLVNLPHQTPLSP